MLQSRGLTYMRVLNFGRFFSLKVGSTYMQITLYTGIYSSGYSTARFWPASLHTVPGNCFGQVLTCVRYNWCHMCQVVTLANGRALITVNTCLLTNFECRLQLICNYSTREVTWLQWPTLAELAHVLFPLYKSLVHHDRYPDKISSTFQKSPTLLVGRLNIWISNGRLNGDLSGVLSPVGDVMNPQTIQFPTPSSSVPVLTFLPQSPLVCEVSLHSF